MDKWDGSRWRLSCCTRSLDRKKQGGVAFPLPGAIRVPLGLLSQGLAMAA